jgi:hypothetical protein
MEILGLGQIVQVALGLSVYLFSFFESFFDYWVGLVLVDLTKIDDFFEHTLFQDHRHPVIVKRPLAQVVSAHYCDVYSVL